MSEHTPIRVMVVDDHAIVREGVRMVLDVSDEFDVSAEASSVAEAIALIAADAPDVVILDISMPGGSGLKAVPDILERAPGVRILMLSMHDNTEYVVESVQAGAHGYLRKDSAPAELRAAVHAVHRGNAYFSPQVATKVAEALRAATGVRPPGRAPASTLTARERQVLARVARGLSNKEIGAELGIATRTVEAHRDSLSRKLGVRTTAGLTRYALENGIDS